MKIADCCAFLVITGTVLRKFLQYLFYLFRLTIACGRQYVSCKAVCLVGRENMGHQTVLQGQSNIRIEVTLQYVGSLVWVSIKGLSVDHAWFWTGSGTEYRTHTEYFCPVGPLLAIVISDEPLKQTCQICLYPTKRFRSNFASSQQ